MGSLPDTGPISVQDIVSLFDISTRPVGFASFRELGVDGVPTTGLIGMGHLRGKGKPIKSQFSITMNSGKTWRGSAENGVNVIRLLTGTPLEFTLVTSASLPGATASQPRYALRCLTAPFNGLCVKQAPDGTLVLEPLANTAAFVYRIVTSDSGQTYRIYCGTGSGGEWPYNGAFVFYRGDDRVATVWWSDVFPRVVPSVSVAFIMTIELPATAISSVPTVSGFVRRYPPGGMGWNDVTFNDTAYGAGRYVLTSINTTQTSGREVWLAFNDDSWSFFQPGGSRGGGILTLELPFAIKLSYYTVVSTSQTTFAGRTPRGFHIRGSNDGTNYTQIPNSDYDNGGAWEADVMRTIIVNATVAWRYLRFEVTALAGSNLISVGELTFYGST